MSKSRKKSPIVKDKCPIKYNRIIRSNENKIIRSYSQYINTPSEEDIEKAIGLSNEELIERFSGIPDNEIDVPCRDEIVNQWDICDWRVITKDLKDLRK